MPKKIVITLAVFVLIGALTFGVAFALEPDRVSLPKAITSESPCPAVGCASGKCHGFDTVPTPDGIHEMDCPEASCSSVSCHAWDTLVTRYYQPSDASMNVWIVAPVVLVVILVLLVRKL